VDELAATDHDADMRRATAFGFEEEQVACLHLVQIDGTTSTVLLADLARQ
jgi:hypothetical protein